MTKKFDIAAADRDNGFNVAAEDRNVMRSSLRQLREETHERSTSDAVARAIDLAAAATSEKEILQRMDVAFTDAYAFEEAKRQEQYEYEEAARSQQYEYDESKRQELRSELEVSLAAAKSERVEMNQTAALARRENHVQVDERFRSNAVERILDALCTSVELMETNDIRDAENAQVKRQALDLEKRVQTKILDESKQQSDLRFALQEEVDKRLELAEAEREHNRSQLESMIVKEKEATKISFLEQKNEM